MPKSNKSLPTRSSRLPLAASGLVFFGSALLSAVPFYSGQPLDPKRAMISNLASPGENPHGYLWMDAGAVLAAILLAPIAPELFRSLRPIRHPARHRLATAGSLLFGAGLTAALVFGLRAPFEDGITGIHIDLAYAAFILTAAGIFLFLLAATGANPILRGAAIVHGCVLAFVLYLFAGEFHTAGFLDFFDDRTFLRSVALCEWLLCAESFACLWLLTTAALTGSKQ